MPKINNGENIKKKSGFTKEKKPYKTRLNIWFLPKSVFHSIIFGLYPGFCCGSFGGNPRDADTGGIAEFALFMLEGTLRIG